MRARGESRVEVGEEGVENRLLHARTVARKARGVPPLLEQQRPPPVNLLARRLSLSAKGEYSRVRGREKSREVGGATAARCTTLG